MVTRLKHRAAAVVREALMRRPHQRRRVKLARLRTGRLVLGAVTVLGMMAGLWVAPAPVAADNSWHEESGEPWPDHGTYFSWCWDSSVGAALDHHISAAERLLENYTVVNVRRQSCGAHTDVRWDKANLSGGWGFTFCMDTNTRGLCDNYISTTDKAAIDNNNDIENKSNQYRKTACHELGHTATLAHYPRNADPQPQMTRHDCIRDGEWDSGSFHSHSYESHHRYDHISAYF